jgi:hypothetical protein
LGEREVDHLWPTLLGVVIGTAAPWPLKAVWQVLRGRSERETVQANLGAARDAAEFARLTKRASDLEELVDLLRKALDKHLIRESAIASACELLIALAKLVPDPSGAMLHIRDRAQQLLEDARAHTLRVDQSGDE